MTQPIQAKSVHFKVMVLVWLHPRTHLTNCIESHGFKGNINQLPLVETDFEVSGFLPHC